MSVLPLQSTAYAGQMELLAKPHKAIPHSAPGQMRLFLALMPSTRTQRAIVRWCDAWQWAPGARRTRSERLHLTLHFLGDVPAALLPVLRAQLHVDADPFTLRLGAPNFFNRATAVLEPLDIPPALANLHAALAQALARCGVRSVRGAFRPHITLARDAAGSRPPDAPLHIAGRVREYMLIRSDLQPPATYHVERVFTL
jgi:RNA 2',3'-cyclic 3'-phosphodiesterase